MGGKKWLHLNKFKGMDHGSLLANSSLNISGNKPTISTITQPASLDIYENIAARKSYFLDFVSPDFWKIYVPHIKSPVPPRAIEDFFNVFHIVEEVIFVVKNKDMPTIDATLLILHINGCLKKLPASVFRLALPKQLTNIYHKHLDNYKNLQHFLWVLGKDVEVQKK